MKPLALLVTLLAASAVAGESTLVPGMSIERELPLCSEHVYTVYLRAGEVLRGRVEQMGVSVVIRLVAPNGSEMLSIDNQEESLGKERLLLVANITGEYQCVIAAGPKETHVGKYKLDVLTIAPAKEADATEHMAEILLSDAWNMARFGQRSALDRATILEEALSLCRSAGAHECEADALEGLAYHLWYAGRDLGKGRDYLLASLPFRHESDDRWTEGMTLNDLGLLSLHIGDYADARDYLERARRLRFRGNAPDPLIDTHLAQTYWRLGELQTALDQGHHALKEWTEINDLPGMALIHATLGRFYLQLGDPQEALRYHLKELELWKQANWSGGIAQGMLDVARDEEALGKSGRALDTYREAFRIFKANNFPPGEASAQQSIGALLIRSGDVDGALKAFQAALELCRIAGISDAEATRGVADVYAKKGQRAAALDWYERAMRTGDEFIRMEANLGIARVQSGAGDLAGAQKTLDDALASLESLRYRLSDPELRGSYLSVRQAFYDLSIDVRMRRHREIAGLELSERARGRALLDSVPLSRIAETDTDSRLTARELAIRGRISGKAIALQKSKSAEALQLKAELAALLVEYRQIEEEIRRANPHLAALTGEPLRVSQIQEQLDPDVLLLEYSLGDQRSYVWGVTRHEVVSAILPSRAAIEKVARRLAELLPLTRKREFETQARRAAARLSEAVLSPMQHLLRDRRLVIIADGALQYVPFGVLPDPRSPLRPLLVEHEISFFPSASLISILRQPSPRRASRLIAVMADPVLRSDDPRVTGAAPAMSPPADLMRSLRDFRNVSFERLPYTRKEADSISALVTAGQRLSAVDFAANRAFAVSGELSRYRIVHFATHGLLNAEHPELSGLVLSLVDEQGKPQDGFLRLQDIYNLHLSADLVVLSACRTALGKDVRREGLVGLARGFMHAGSPRVVASLWDVRDLATAELMNRFYTFLLKEHHRPAKALRLAQLSVWQEARWNAPFYWGGFVLQGEWR